MGDNVKMKMATAPVFLKILHPSCPPRICVWDKLQQESFFGYFPDVRLSPQAIRRGARNTGMTARVKNVDSAVLMENNWEHRPLFWSVTLTRRMNL